MGAIDIAKYRPLGWWGLLGHFEVPVRGSIKVFTSLSRFSSGKAVGRQCPVSRVAQVMIDAGV